MCNPLKLALNVAFLKVYKVPAFRHAQTAWYIEGLEETQRMSNNTENFDNIDFIRRLNRIILEEAFRMMTEGVPCDNKIDPNSPKSTEEQNPPKTSVEQRDLNAQRNMIIHRHYRMWGKDTPATDMLSEIASTELKIEKERPSHAVAEKRPPLSERDIDLLREFMRKDFE